MLVGVTFLFGKIIFFYFLNFYLLDVYSELFVSIEQLFEEMFCVGNVFEEFFSIDKLFGLMVKVIRSNISCQKIGVIFFYQKKNSESFFLYEKLIRSNFSLWNFYSKLFLIVEMIFGVNFFYGTVSQSNFSVGGTYSE